MSATTPSQALGDAGETLTAASHSAANDRHSLLDHRDGPLTALAIEVCKGHIGCAVFSEEEQQLLLCEDLPYRFAFREEHVAPSAFATSASANESGEGGEALAAQSAAPSFSHPSYGHIESREHKFSLHLPQNVEPMYSHI